MDYFETLPFGVLICIVKHLCPSSIDLFDSVAVKELQKARLISRKVCSQRHVLQNPFTRKI